ncbi:MAG: GNAT family N-acetyltransferase [Armatimonadetes bacterium]|nr:GNAT family N-acetyltransferase [Armatimonadota bacterium]
MFNRSRKGTFGAAGIAATCVKTAEEVEALCEAWDALAARDATATTYQGSAWLATWFRHHPNVRPRVFVAFRGDRLTAAIPLCAYRARFQLASTRILRLAADNDSDYGNALVDPEHPGDLAELVGAGLLRSRTWDLLDLRHIPASASLAQAVRAASGPSRIHHVAQDVAPYLDIRSEWQASVSRNQRSQVLRHRRQLEAEGPVAFDVARSADEVVGMLDQFARIHIARWRQRGETSVFCIPTQRAWLHAACQALHQRGELYLCRLALAGNPVSMGLYVLSGRRLTNYMIAFQEEYRRFGPAHLLIAAAIEDVRRRNLADIHDFGRGGEEYKLRWTRATQPLERILVARRSLAGSAALCWAARVQPFIWRHYRAATLLREFRRRREARRSA